MSRPDVSEAVPTVGGEPERVADGVFVLPDRRAELVPNIGFVVGERAVLVVDTGLGPSNGEYVLSQARRLAGERPLYLTTTHFHPEHAFGAQAFRGAATIVGNRAQRDELRRKGAAYLGMFSGFGDAIAAALRDVELVEPDLVYDGEAELDLGGRKVVLRAVGPAHTAGDQLVLVDDRVVFGGDLFESRIFPILPYFPPHDADVDPDRWIELLARLAAEGPEVVVPGHGEVSDVTLLRDVHDYLVHLRDETARLAAEGVPADDAAATIGEAARSRWSTWERPEWITAGVHAWYGLRGE
ncbi:MBL fold metallo-hydrolase [Amycolatopsis sacchari]|uniref:MBL fold metallo-hydrolase n=1 Tax=Amycolatopsis sacchari TaxID=115433 RepID=UPI003D7335B1